MQVTNVFLSDAHIGSTVGLCKPTNTLDDGGTYKASKGQSWLWRNWEDLLSRLERLEVDQIIVHLTGDIAEGDFKNRSLQLATRNPTTVQKWAVEIFEPLKAISTALFVYRGTPAHIGPSAIMEEQIAADLEAVKCPETGTYSWLSSKFVSEGVRFDITHQPKGGTGRRANRYGVVDRLAADTLFEYADRGEPPPHLVIRSHLHQYLDSYDHFRTRGIVTPAWTLATEYVQRLSPNGLAEIGAILVHCSAGNYQVDPIKYTPDKQPYYSIGDLQSVR